MLTQKVLCRGLAADTVMTLEQHKAPPLCRSPILEIVNAVPVKVNAILESLEIVHHPPQWRSRSAKTPFTFTPKSPFAIGRNTLLAREVVQPGPTLIAKA